MIVSNEAPVRPGARHRRQAERDPPDQPARRVCEQPRQRALHRVRPIADRLLVRPQLDRFDRAVLPHELRAVEPAEQIELGRRAAARALDDLLAPRLARLEQHVGVDLPRRDVVGVGGERRFELSPAASCHRSS
jgi:hypothetical protein